MKKLTGAMTLIVGILLMILFVYGLNYTINVDGTPRTDEVVSLIAAIIFGLCAIHYALVTKFWKTTPSIIEGLDQENEIIKRQIEKEELLARLEKAKTK